MTHPTTRDIPLVPSQSALLFIDVQNFSARRDGAEFKNLPDAEFNAKYGWFFAEMKARIIPNMQRLQAAFRKAGVEVMYTTIESLTKDGRDRSLDYKITGASHRDCAGCSRCGWRRRRWRRISAARSRRRPAPTRRSPCRERHDNSLRAIKGYCRQKTTDQVIGELS